MRRPPGGIPAHSSLHRLWGVLLGLTDPLRQQVPALVTDQVGEGAGKVTVLQVSSATDTPTLPDLDDRHAAMACNSHLMRARSVRRR
jgi:hypothetical protein